MSDYQAGIKKINHLIALLLRLDAAPAGGINLQHFAATANVHIRTVQRDIKLLNECLNLTENKRKNSQKDKSFYIERKGNGNYGFQSGYSLAKGKQGSFALKQQGAGFPNRKHKEPIRHSLPKHEQMRKVI